MPEKKAVLEELGRIYREGLTGVLSLTLKNQSVEVFYRDGLIDAVSSTVAGDQLGQHLVNGRVLSEAELQQALDKSGQENIMLGEATARLGFLDPSEISEELRNQAFEILNSVVKRSFMVGGFTDGLLQVSFAPARINFDHLLLELCRRNPKPLQIEPNQLFLINGRDVSHLPWYPQELLVLGELKSVHSIDTLLASTGMDREKLTAILDVFCRLSLIKWLGPTPSDTDPNQAITESGRFPLEQFTPEVGNAVVSEKLEVLNRETSFITEQFKNLKVRVEEARRSASVRVLTISSPDAQDGKSLISINLAAALSMDFARRIVIVDCDLRNPSLDKYLGVSLTPGVLGFLASPHLRPYCYLRRFKNLYFVTAGGTTNKPVEHLSTARMAEFITYLRSEFDTIILDAPPFAPMSDARILTSLSDALIMVVRSGRTSYSSMEKALKTVDQTKLLGVVFNDVTPMPFHTQYNRAYYRYGEHSLYPYYQPRSGRARSAKNYLGS